MVALARVRSAVECSAAVGVVLRVVQAGKRHLGLVGPSLLIEVLQTCIFH